MQNSTSSSSTASNTDQSESSNQPNALPGLAPIKFSEKSQQHKVIITGRGQGAGRTSTLVRLRPDVISEIKEVVDGPLYLIIEVALRMYAQELRKRPEGSILLIDAKDLN